MLWPSSRPTSRLEAPSPGHEHPSSCESLHTFVWVSISAFLDHRQRTVSSDARLGRPVASNAFALDRNALDAARHRSHYINRLADILLRSRPKPVQTDTLRLGLLSPSSQRTSHHFLGDPARGMSHNHRHSSNLPLRGPTTQSPARLATAAMRERFPETPQQTHRSSCDSSAASTPEYSFSPEAQLRASAMPTPARLIRDELKEPGKYPSNSTSTGLSRAPAIISRPSSTQALNHDQTGSGSQNGEPTRCVSVCLSAFQYIMQWIE